jgi:hypothetical protein
MYFSFLLMFWVSMHGTEIDTHTQNHFITMKNLLFQGKPYLTAATVQKTEPGLEAEKGVLGVAMTQKCVIVPV